MHLNLVHLSYIIAAAKTGSITSASVETSISQPTISAAISGMEETYGYSLFVRNRAKGLSLTPTGRHFVLRAQKLLDEASTFHNEALGYGAHIVGEVQVACYYVIAPYILPPIIRELKKQHPGLRVRPHEASLIDVVNTVKEGIADIAITYDMFDDSSVKLEKLLPVRPHVLMSRDHPLADRPSVSLNDLAPHPFVMLDIPGVREYYQTLFRQRGIQPDVQFRARSLELVRSMVGMNMGYSFALLPILSQRSYNGDVIVRRPVSPEVDEAYLCLVSPKQTSVPRKTEVFADICRRSIQQAIEIHSRDMYG
ncbi:MAG: LysR family transcriptional regulator [Rhodospirillales bacterium]|nr:LysR family transcriptional regulator [Rhodospirillales bacterium]